MEQKSEEQALIEIICGAIPKIRSRKSEFTPKSKSLIGFFLGYFVTDILKSEKDSNIRGKWIDAIEFRELRLLKNGSQISGWGLIWWGYRKDSTSETFPDTFFCQLAPNYETQCFDSYSFSFWIDHTKYELERDFQSPNLS